MPQIQSVTILASGWEAELAIDAVGTAGTYLLDATNERLEDESTAKVVFTVVSEGYTPTGSATTVTRTVYGTTPRRKASPNNAQYEERIDGGSGHCIVTVALSEPIYNDDKNGGAGTSGTNPTCDVLANFYTQGGTATAQTLGVTVTNNSTLDYPIVFGQRDLVLRQRVTNDFRLGFTARQKHGVAAVRFDATGVTSSANYNTTVAQETARQRTTSGLYATAHEATIPITGFTQGEEITCRVRAYPIIGDSDSIFDSNNYTSERHITGRGTFSMYCDKTGGLVVYAVVDTVSGNDSTGTASATLATAEASPFLTIGKAREGTATVIYVKNTGVTPIHGYGGSNRSINYFLEVLPHPNNSGATIITSDSTNRSTNCTRIKYSGFVMRRADTNSWMDGTDTSHVWFDQCDFDDNGVGNLGVPLGYQHLGMWFTDCYGDFAPSSWRLGMGFSTANVGYAFDGNIFAETEADVGGMNNWYRMTANKGTGAINSGMHTTSGLPKQNGALYEFNEFLANNTSVGANILGWGQSGTGVGLSIIGNVLHKTGATSAGLSICGDNNTGEYDHIIIAHNTITAVDGRGRANLCYNEVGSTAYAKKLWAIKYNNIIDFNTKHDLFAPANGARIGGWRVLFGVSMDGNCYQASGFPGEFKGLNTDTSASISYVDATGGDFRTASTDVKDRVRVGGRYVTHDLYGTELFNTGAALSGAVQSTVDTTHTLDAYLQEGSATDTETHTLDALLNKTETDTHSVDALLNKSVAATHTLDALLQKAATVVHTIDSLLRLSVTATQTLDALLEKTNTSDHTLDALLKKAESKTHTIDALLAQLQTTSHTIDALLRAAGQQTHTIDTILKKQEQDTHTADAYLLKQEQATHTLDAYLEEIGGASNAHTIDSLLIKAQTNTHTIDALLVESNQIAHTLDALLKEVSTLTHTVDALLNKSETKTHTSDALLKKIATATHTLDVYIVRLETSTHTLDTYLAEAADAQSHTIDALLRARVTKSNSIDALISAGAVRTQANVTLYLPKRDHALYLPKRDAILY